MSNQCESLDSLIELEFSHYRTIEEFGNDGMRVLSRPDDQHLDREVVIDVLSPVALTDEASLKFVRKEDLARSKLNHRNIDIISYCHTQGSVDFLEMEYIPEQILYGHLMKREEKWTTSQKLLRE